MVPFARYLSGFVVALLALFALYVASRADGGGLYAGGLIIFLMCVFFIGALIKDSFDEAGRSDQT